MADEAEVREVIYWTRASPDPVHFHNVGTTLSDLGDNHFSIVLPFPLNDLVPFDHLLRQVVTNRAFRPLPKKRRSDRAKRAARTRGRTANYFAL